VGLGWGIPFHDIKLTAVTDTTVAARLTALAKAEVNYKLFCVLNDDARDWFKQLRVVTTSVIAGKDGEPVLASKMTPTQAMEKYFAIIKDSLKALGGKGDAPLEDAIKTFTDNTVPLASGTAVEVKELEQGAAGGGPAMPPFPFPKLPAGGKGGKADDPFKALGKIFGSVAEGVNVKVKVLDGPHKGKELWVVREFIRRETVIQQVK
jgi:hypothetical protein